MYYAIVYNLIFEILFFIIVKDIECATACWQTCQKLALNKERKQFFFFWLE